MLTSRHALIGILLGISITFGASWAADGAGAHEESMFGYGVVDRIDTTAQEIVIDDGFYRLSPSMRIHGLANRTETVYGIKKNDKVRYTTAPAAGRNSASQVTEIWILPKNYKIPRGR